MALSPGTGTCFACPDLFGTYCNPSTGVTVNWCALVITYLPLCILLTMRLKFFLQCNKLRTS